MKILKGLILLLICSAITIFAVSNRQDVDIYFFFTDSIIQVPLFIFFFVSIFVGVVVAAIGTLFYRLKTRNEIKRQQNKIKALESEVASIKTEIKVSESLS